MTISPSATSQSLTIHGRGASLTFPGRLFLAPMEGITDTVFRSEVIRLGGVGGACTEFIRISVNPVPKKVILRYFGEPRTDTPVGIQLMAADADNLTPTIHNAEACGAPWIDLNFGCPAPVVFSKCAGSAMLAKPAAIAEIVRNAVAATQLPISVKIRAGITDASRLGEVVCAAADAGAAMITVHARLRIHGYHQPAHWSWISEAVTVLRQAGHQIPLIGNGAVDTPHDVARMFAETGCDGVMIGRAALANPWIFNNALGGPEPTRAQAVQFVHTYAAAIRAVRTDSVCYNKLKQLTRWYRAGNLFDGREEQRTQLLRGDSLNDMLQWYEGAACD